MKEYIATFYSHYGALCFKRNCEKQGMEAVIMPVPRNLSSSCGTCVEFSPAAADFDAAALAAMEYESIYRIEGESFELLYHID